MRTAKLSWIMFVVTIFGPVFAGGWAEADEARPFRLTLAAADLCCPRRRDECPLCEHRAHGSLIRKSRFEVECPLGAIR
jgi:hypothetical protein